LHPFLSSFCPDPILFGTPVASLFPLYFRVVFRPLAVWFLEAMVGGNVGRTGGEPTAQREEA